MPGLLVMTSGNTPGRRSAEMMRRRQRSFPISVTAFLSHNRKIRIRADDLVMDFIRVNPYMIRRSSGMRLFRLWSHTLKGQGDRSRWRT